MRVGVLSSSIISHFLPTESTHDWGGAETAINRSHAERVKKEMHVSEYSINATGPIC